MLAWASPRPSQGRFCGPWGWLRRPSGRRSTPPRTVLRLRELRVEDVLAGRALAPADPAPDPYPGVDDAPLPERDPDGAHRFVEHPVGAGPADRVGLVVEVMQDRRPLGDALE